MEATELSSTQSSALQSSLAPGKTDVQSTINSEHAFAKAVVGGGLQRRTSSTRLPQSGDFAHGEEVSPNAVLPTKCSNSGLQRPIPPEFLAKMPRPSTDMGLPQAAVSRPSLSSVASQWLKQFVGAGPTVGDGAGVGGLPAHAASDSTGGFHGNVSSSNDNGSDIQVSDLQLVKPGIWNDRVDSIKLSVVDKPCSADGADKALDFQCKPCSVDGALGFRSRYREINPWDLAPAEVDEDEQACSADGGPAPWDAAGEASSIKPLRHPAAPTVEERLAHEVSHLPYRAWCRSCVAGRGRDLAHSRLVDRTQDSVPVISIDYCYLGEEARLADGTLWSPSPILVAVDSHTRFIGAWVHPCKGPSNEYCVKTLVDFVVNLGYGRVLIKCDQENSVRALRLEAASRIRPLNIDVAFEDAQRGISQSNSIVEIQVKLVKGLTRSLIHFTNERHGVVLAASSDMMAWAVCHAAFLLNRGERSSDGRTPFELLRGRPYRKALPVFGDKIQWMELGKKLSTAKMRYFDGIFVGARDRSDELFVSTPNGTHRCRAVRRLDPLASADKEFLLSVRGTPWEPLTQSEARPRQVRVDTASLVPPADLPPPVQEETAKATRTPRVYLRDKVEFEKYGYSPGCPACLALASGSRGPNHTQECRDRITRMMEQDAMLQARLVKSDERRVSRRSVQAQDPVDPAPVVSSAGASSAADPMQITASAPLVSDTVHSSNVLTSRAAMAQSVARMSDDDPLISAAVKRRAPDEIHPDDTAEASQPKVTSSSSSSGLVRTGQKRGADGDHPDDEVSHFTLESLLQDEATQALIQQCDLDRENLLLLNSVGGLLRPLESVHVAEIFSPGRFGHCGKTFGLNQGFAWDLRNGWNFEIPAHKAQFYADYKATLPFFILMSPRCTAFSILQMLNPKTDREKWRRLWNASVKHIEFCLEVARMQHDAGRLFLFEQPWSAMSWKLPCVMEALNTKGYFVGKGDQCPFGAQSLVDLSDPESIGAILKETGWLTNSQIVLEAVTRRCQNRVLPKDSPQRHTHVQLLDGRAKYAEHYPERLVNAILKAVREELRDRSLMSINGDSFASLPHVDEEAKQVPPAEYWDEISGTQLDPLLVKKARAEEVNWMETHGQWTLVPYSGQHLIGTRFVDVNKGDRLSPEVRCRLVAQDTKYASSIKGYGIETFAATPPLEALRLLFAIHMTHSPSLETHILRFLDIKKAHLIPLIDREVFLRLPSEANVPEGFCAKLNYSLYGLRDAGKLFDSFMEGIFKELNFRVGVYAPSIFYDARTKTRIFKYGDDLVVSGDRAHVDILTAELRKRMDIKTRATLGLRADFGDVLETSILNRPVRLCNGSHSNCHLEYEADPRHVEILQSQVGLSKPGTKGVVSPGLKRSGLSCDSPELTAEEKAVFRSAAMRASYLSHDRVDIQFACKELARHLNSPRVCHYEELKRLVRYLISNPRLILHFKRERASYTVVQLVDSDWAGCADTRRSTSCSITMLGSSCLKSSSTTQLSLATSSGEAEYYSLVKGASSALGMVSLCADMGLAVKLKLRCDSSASIGIAQRRGAGKVRHISVSTLWLQGHIASGAISLDKIAGKQNPPDLGTKHLAGNAIEPLLTLISQRRACGRPAGMPLAHL